MPEGLTVKARSRRKMETLSVAQIIGPRKDRIIVNNKSERMWNEMVVTQFEIQTRNFL
jgi:hypothetical protein